MNRFQKVAWFTLVMLTLATILSLSAFSVAYFIFGFPAKRAICGLGFTFTIIGGFSGLAPLIFKRDKDKVKLDERDLIIRRKATLVAYWMSWTLFTLAATITWFIMGPDGTISVNYLPWMGVGGIFIIVLVQSIVILEEYGWGDKDEQ